MIEFFFFPRSLQESGKFVNQFPNENSLLCKDLLAAVCQNATPPETGKEDDLLRRGPEWLPVTFNLALELPLFLQHYLKRKERYDYHKYILEWFSIECRLRTFEPKSSHVQIFFKLLLQLDDDQLMSER